VFWLLSQPLPHLVGHHLRRSIVLERIYRPVVKLFAPQTLPTINKNYLFMNILCIESFFSQKKPHNRTLLFASILLKYGRHFDYWKQPLNMRMRVCYLFCHEAGLCCYLVIHTENLLNPLQLFYVHLRSIYWLSLVYCERLYCIVLPKLWIFLCVNLMYVKSSITKGPAASPISVDYG
jgi:hypothetical protein